MVNDKLFKKILNIENGTSEPVFRVILKLPKGKLNSVETSIFDKNYLEFSTNFLFLFFEGVLSQNKHEDKLELMRPELHKSYKLDDSNLKAVESLKRVELLDPILLRASILYGLAICAVIQKSEVSGFFFTQKTSDRAFRLKHNVVSKLIPELKSEDIEKQIDEAFYHLWFNYPSDLSGQDNRLKRITLENFDNPNTSVKLPF